MRNLVPIRVKIGLWNTKTTDAGGEHLPGHAKYPNFNILPVISVSGMDWSVYNDVLCCCWHYDKKCGHKEEDLVYGSPVGVQFGVMMVPQQFAIEALDVFPGEVTELTKIELQDFYDNRAHAHEPDELLNQAALDPFEAAVKGGKTLNAAQQIAYDKALDPNDEAPGITKNKRKKWVDFKALVDINIIST